MKPNTPVVVQAYRTPQGKEDGVFADVRSEDLSLPLIQEILAETGLTGEYIDDLMWGCAQQREEQGNNLARVIALLSELGESVPATTVNRWCASSAQVVISAADAIRAGQRDAIIAGGVENMSRVKMGSNGQNLHPKLNEQYNVADLQMGMTAEKVAEEYEISRETQDEYAARSQQRAVEATKAVASTRNSFPSIPRMASSRRTRDFALEPPRKSSRDSRRCSRRTAPSRPATPRRFRTGRRRCS